MILVPEFGTIGFSTIRDTIKTIYIKLGDLYLDKYGLEYTEKMADLEQRSTIVMLPLIKPSYDIIASNVYMSGPLYK